MYMGYFLHRDALIGLILAPEVRLTEERRGLKGLPVLNGKILDRKRGKTGDDIFRQPPNVPFCAFWCKESRI